MRRKLLGASAILMAAFIASQVLRFAGNVLLAKLLSPSAFGIVAVVNLLILALNLLSDVGLRLIVIQRQGPLTQKFLNTVWGLQIGRGVLIWALSLACAFGLRVMQWYGLIDAHKAYADPLLPFLIAGAATAALFQGVESTKSLTERRALSLMKVTVIQLVAQVAAMVLMIGVAWVNASPWALVIGGIAAAAVQTLLSHTWLPGETNRFEFDRSIARDVLMAGRWVFVSSMVSFLGGNADILMLGGLTDPASLGNYVVAFQLINVVQILVSTISGNVVFPAFSEARRDALESLPSKYRRLQLVSDAIVVSASSAFFVAGSAIVTLLFDHRYAQAGQVLSWLAIGVLGLRYYVVEQLMNAEGNFRLTTLIAIARLVAMVVCAYGGFRLGGLNGAAIGVGLSTFAGWPVSLWYRHRTVGTDWRVEAALPVFLAAGAAIGWAVAAVIHLYK